MNNKSGVKLSVIVAVYNTEKYLRQCIDSILKQNYTNIEIILVDDGSTDSSGDICDKYKLIDKRIQVIHQKNSGSILARLQGIKNSQGEYIGFVDSDDWIDVDMYTVLMSVAEEKKCDIVSMGYTSVHDGKEKREDDATLFGIYEKGKNLNVLLSKMMYDSKQNKRGVHPSLCTKVIKRKYLVNMYDDINEKITMGEDAAVFYPCCLQINNIFILKEYKYYYRIHNESMCRTMNIDSIREIYFFYQYMIKVLSEYGTQYDLLGQLKKYIWTIIEPSLSQIFQFQVKKIYIFPYTMIERGSDIILYGAGEVGQIYYSQIIENNYCNIIAWVDKNKSDEKSIMRPNEILNLTYSKVVIAIRNREIANEAIGELNALGINKEKLFWSAPQQILPMIY